MLCAKAGAGGAPGCAGDWRGAFAAPCFAFRAALCRKAGMRTTAGESPVVDREAGGEDSFISTLGHGHDAPCIQGSADVLALGTRAGRALRTPVKLRSAASLCISGAWESS